MSAEQNPRVVRKEFGLLYGGLFNKIRFPGRYEVDESGNKVVDSPYNMPQIDFTGDVADLYFEPDTFYIDNNNDLMIRKRKRDDEGQVTETQRLKVGKLDLEATEAMRQEFVTLGEAQNQVNSIVGGELDRLRELLSKYTKNSEDLTGFVDLLQQQINDRIVDFSELSPELQGLINEKVNKEQVESQVLAMTYRRGTIDEKLADLANQLEGTGSGLRTDASNEAAFVRQALETVAASSGGAISDLRRILEDQYLKLSSFNDIRPSLVDVTGLDNRLANYLETSRYDSDVNGFLATRPYVSEFAYSKPDIDTRLNQIMSDLTGTTDQQITERYIDSIKSYVSYSNFANALGVEIPNYQSLAYNEDVNGAEDRLRARIQEVRTIADSGTSQTAAVRAALDALEDRVQTFRDSISDMITERINSLDGDTTALQNLFQSTINANGSAIDSLSTRITNAAEALGFGSEPAARTFAFISELEPVENRVNTLRDSTIPTLQTEVDNNTSLITTNQQTFSTFRDRVIADFLDLTDTTKVNNFKNDLSVGLAGFTKDEMRGFLNSFYNANFGPATYYPSRKGWARVVVSKASGQSDIGLDQNADLYGNTTSDGTTTSARVRLAAPSGTAIPGGDFGLAPQQMIDLIETSYDNVDFFRIFKSQGDIYVLYPSSVLLGTGSSVAGRDMRFQIHLQDTTPDNVLVTTNYTPYPVHLWRQTVREYDPNDQTIARIDRVVPIRPWSSTTTPSRFRFEMDITCAPDHVGFVGLGTVGTS